MFADRILVLLPTEELPFTAVKTRISRGINELLLQCNKLGVQVDIPVISESMDLISENIKYNSLDILPATDIAIASYGGYSTASMVKVPIVEQAKVKALKKYPHDPMKMTTVELAYRAANKRIAFILKEIVKSYDAILYVNIYDRISMLTLRKQPNKGLYIKVDRNGEFIAQYNEQDFDLSILYNEQE